MQNIDIKKELLYFIKSILLVIIISGMLSALVYFMIKGVDIQGTLDQQDMILTLANYRIAIIIVSILVTTYILHESRKLDNIKAFAIQFTKVVAYYGCVQILLYQIV